MLDYLAKTITHNGRDLEGAINRLLAHSKLSSTPVTLEMAEREVRDLVRPQEPRARQDRGHPARGGAAIQCQPLGPPVVAPHRQCRAPASGRDVSRQDPDAALAAAKSDRRFGGRDHTTVLHAVRKIEALQTNDTGLAGEIELAEAPTPGLSFPASFHR